MWTAGFWSRFTNERFVHGDFTDDFEPCGKTNFTHSGFFKICSRSFHGGFRGHRCVCSRSFHGGFHGHRHIFQSGFHGGFHDPFCRCFWTSKFVFSRVFSWLFPCSRPASRHHVVARGPGGPRASGPGPGPQAKVHFPCAGIVAKCVSCESSIAARLVSAI